MNGFSRWADFLQSLLYPHTCLLCGDPGEGGLDVCGPCLQDLPWLTSACPRCALPLADTELVCGACLRDLPPFDYTHALWRYRPPVTGLIAALKFRRRRHCARLMGEILGRHLVAKPRPDCLVPVPLHPRRQRERGFNQSTEIARFAAKDLQIPLRPLCRRIRTTPPQRLLSAGERRTNLAGAFAAAGDLRGLRIAVIDDVMTTGATVREVASTLKRAGAAEVGVWVLARA